METVKEKPMKLYAVRDKATGKLVSNITNPRRKYWDREVNCKNAISTYKRRNRGCELEMVEFTLVENYDERQLTPVLQEWVSVDERLPEMAGEYIVMIKGAKNPTCLFFDVDAWIDEVSESHNVTHWREFPEQPKEVQ